MAYLSATLIGILTPCLRYPVGEADFTVDDDRRTLGPVIQAMIESKQAAALRGGDVVTFRVLHVMKDRLLLGTGAEEEREATLSEWLAALKLAGPTDADECMGALHYAVLAGRVDLAAVLLDQGADLNRLVTRSRRSIASGARSTYSSLLTLASPRSASPSATAISPR